MDKKYIDYLIKDVQEQTQVATEKLVEVFHDYQFAEGYLQRELSVIMECLKFIELTIDKINEEMND